MTTGILSAGMTVFLALPVAACDLCAIYPSSHANVRMAGGFYYGLAEQFTHFGALQLDGRKVPNDAKQYFNSSISQGILGYNFTEKVGVQVNVPLIYRTFRRPDGAGGIDRGSLAGLGDLSLTGRYFIVQKEAERSAIFWHLLGGVKFPTGSTRRLRDEVDEAAAPPPPPGLPESGIHGHDLTLGSGSYDGIAGTGVYVRYRRWFFTGDMQYAIRSAGAYDYHFANDLLWAGGPGLFLVMNEKWTLALQANVSGEHKGRDHFRGALADDTGFTSVFMGPQLRATFFGKLAAMVGADLPVNIRNTALQVVPDYRLRAGLQWQF